MADDRALRQAFESANNIRLSDEEWARVLVEAESMGLSVGAGHLWVSRRRSGDAGETRFLVAVSIDGVRARAAQTGVYGPQYGPLWCGTDLVWREVWLGSQDPAACKIGGRRTTQDEPTWVVVRMVDYKPTKNPSPNWKSSAPAMLAKCAESLLLRKLYPEVGRAYVLEEMDNVGDDDTAAALPRAPRAIAAPASVPVSAPDETEQRSPVPVAVSPGGDGPNHRAMSVLLAVMAEIPAFRAIRRPNVEPEDEDSAESWLTLWLAKVEKVAGPEFASAIQTVHGLMAGPDLPDEAEFNGEPGDDVPF
jgi:hypothetical protein